MLNNTYYKVTNETENHYNFQYKDGLNIDTLNFSEIGSCVPGGLYFTDKGNIDSFYDYGCWIREVFLPINNSDFKMVADDSGDKYRANMIILGTKYDMKDVNTYIKLNIQPCQKVVLDTNKKTDVVFFDTLNEELQKYIIHNIEHFNFVDTEINGDVFIKMTENIEFCKYNLDSVRKYAIEIIGNLLRVKEQNVKVNFSEVILNSLYEKLFKFYRVWWRTSYHHNYRYHDTNFYDPDTQIIICELLLKIAHDKSHKLFEAMFHKLVYTHSETRYMGPNCEKLEQLLLEHPQFKLNENTVIHFSSCSLISEYDNIVYTVTIKRYIDTLKMLKKHGYDIQPKEKIIKILFEDEELFAKFLANDNFKTVCHVMPNNCSYISTDQYNLLLFFKQNGITNLVDNDIVNFLVNSADAKSLFSEMFGIVQLHYDYKRLNDVCSFSEFRSMRILNKYGYPHKITNDLILAGFKDDKLVEIYKNLNSVPNKIIEINEVNVSYINNLNESDWQYLSNKYEIRIVFTGNVTNENCFNTIRKLKNVFTELLFGNKIKYTFNALDVLSADGDIDALDKLVKIKSQYLFYTEHAMDQASANGRINVLDWWIKSGLPLKYGRNAVIWAKNREVLEWWLQSGLKLDFSVNSKIRKQLESEPNEMKELYGKIFTNF